MEVNPGPTAGNLAPHPQSGDLEDDTSDGPNHEQSDSGTLNTEHTPLKSAADTSVSPDMATQNLEAVRQQNGKLQELETNLSHVRNDLSAIKTDIGLVRARCGEIDKRCERLEKENERLSSSMQDTNVDVEKLLDESEENRDPTRSHEIPLGKCLRRWRR